MDFQAYWQAVLTQDAKVMAEFLHADTEILWPNTSERFNAAGYIRANCEYPGDWDGEIFRLERLRPNEFLTVCRVFTKDGSVSHHVCSFFEIEDGKIRKLTEYWGEDGPAPEWRQALDLCL